MSEFGAIERMSGIQGREALNRADPLALIGSFPTELRQKVMKHHIDRAQRARDLITSKHLFNLIATNNDLAKVYEESIQIPTEIFAQRRREYMEQAVEDGDYSLASMLNRPFMARAPNENEGDMGHNAQLSLLNAMEEDEIDHDDPENEIMTQSRFGNLRYDIEDAMPSGLGHLQDQIGIGKLTRTERLSEEAAQIMDRESQLQQKIYEIDEEYTNEYEEENPEPTVSGVVGQSFGGEGGYREQFNMIGPFMTEGRAAMTGAQHPAFNELTTDFFENRFQELANEYGVEIDTNDDWANGGGGFNYDYEAEDEDGDLMDYQARINLDDEQSMESITFGDEEAQGEWTQMLEEYREARDQPLTNYFIMPQWTQRSIKGLSRDLLNEYNLNADKLRRLYHISTYRQFRGKNNPAIGDIPEDES